MSAPLPPVPDLDAMLRIRACLGAARSEEPRLASAAPGDLIRHVKNKRAIIRGRLDGSDVVFRLHLAPEPGVTEREWAEIQRLWPHMSTGDLRIARPICVAPQSGVIVQEYVTGTPLMALLYTLDPPRRAACLRPAAEWLRASTSISEGWRRPQPAVWIARAARASRQQPFQRLGMIEQQILAQMERLAPMIMAEPWRTAICHGDYHPNNLIADGKRLTAIDLGGSRRLPVIRDIARFAMHMGRRRLRLAGRTCLGVDQLCLETFADAFEMSALERGAVLPFFLAFEALIRVENTSLPAARIDRAEKTYQDLLRGLERIGTSRPPI